MRHRAVVVGAGITGLSIARYLTMYENIDVIVVDKNPDVGWGVSKANTSIIHPCHEEDPVKHPLRTRLCLEGHNLWYEWASELDIPVRWPGEIIVATNEDEYKVLYKYLELARINGVPEVRLVEDEELFQLEKHISRKAIAGLYAPSAGTIDPVNACIALAENIIDNGGQLLLGEPVRDVLVSDGKIRGIVVGDRHIDADIVINAAGLYADEISAKAGITDYVIHPRRGQYVLFDKLAQPKPEKIIHTAPTPKTKGVYVVRTVEDTLLVGPTAEDLPRDAKEAKHTTREGIEYVLKNASKIIEKLPPRENIMRTFAGLRPEPSTGTFILRFHDKPWGFVEAAGIRSPGLTAAPAIGRYIKDLILKHVQLKKKHKWIRSRRRILKIKDLEPRERNKLISKNPLYGRIICQCMGVSEAEIVEAINRMKKIGVREITLDGIKFRVHAMYGKCQGAFCRPVISMIVSKHTGSSPWKIRFNTGNSVYGVGFVKDLLLGEKK